MRARRRPVMQASRTRLPRSPGSVGWLTCGGLATVQGSGDNLSLPFPDGAVLKWTTAAIQEPVAAPAASAAAGRRL